jgi:Holliday junction resolvase RusA-like endonuclease
MEACLVIPGQPATKKNSQVARCVNGKPVVLQSKAYRAYEKMALKALLACPRTEFSGPVVVTVHYWLKDKRRPDLNNLMAATADILEKARLITDDREIVSWDGSRIMGTSPNPRAEITIKEADRRF